MPEPRMTPASPASPAAQQAAASSSIPPAAAVVVASWSNKAAERCAGVSWFAVFGVFLASSLAVALPFGAGRWREAGRDAAVSSYPGLGAAFMDLAYRGGNFSVGASGFQVDPIAPTELETDGWLVVLGKPGSPAPDSGKILWLGTERFVVSNPESGAVVASDWTPFQGLDASDLRQAANDRTVMADLISGVLYTAAFSDMASTLVTLGLLMLTQNAFFVSILGVFLSLSALRPRRNQEGTRARMEPLKAIRVSACAMAGPAFLTGILGLALPSLNAALLWLAYSLLGGIRVVILYMARYRQCHEPLG